MMTNQTQNHEAEGGPPAENVMSAIHAKYGKASVAGFQAVPDLLFKHQDHLGISPTDLVVLLNVLMHWWYPHLKPFPRSQTIAKRMGVTPRTVQRSLNNLEKSGLIDRERKKSGGVMYIDPTPLVEKLSKIAETDPDYIVRKGRLDGRDELGPHQPVHG